MATVMRMCCVLNDHPDKRQVICVHADVRTEQRQLPSVCAIPPGDHRTSIGRACFYPRVWTMFAGSARAHLLTKLVPMGSMLPLQGIVISL